MKLKKLAVVLVLMLFVTACSGDAPELLNFINEGSSEVDFGGLTFNILSHGDPGEGLEYVGPGDAPTLRQEMFMERVAEIEETYNCEINCDADTDSNYSTYAISGIERADLVQVRMKHAYGMYASGLFLPLNKVPYVDTSDGKYGTESFIESFTWNGDLIACWPVHWGYIHMGFCDGMFFNPVIFKEIGQATPNERYEMDEWTWDSLQEISDACQDIATGDNPKYLTAMNSYFPRMLISSNGGEFISLNENGDYRYALNQPEVVEAMQFANDLLNEGAINPDGNDHTVVTENFGDGMYAIMCEYNSYYNVYIMDMKDGVGVCYAPKGPQADDYVRTGLSSIENSFWFVTREKNEEVDSLGQFMEIFFQPLDGSTEAWKEEYSDYNFLDEISGEVFLSKMTNVITDRVIFAYDNSTLFDIIEDGSKKGTIAESLQKYESAVNTKLNESINSWKK